VNFCTRMMRPMFAMCWFIDNDRICNGGCSKHTHARTHAHAHAHAHTQATKHNHLTNYPTTIQSVTVCNGTHPTACSSCVHQHPLRAWLQTLGSLWDFHKVCSTRYRGDVNSARLCLRVAHRVC
jgi:hypothetical protein